MVYLGFCLRIAPFDDFAYTGAEFVTPQVNWPTQSPRRRIGVLTPVSSARCGRVSRPAVPTSALSGATWSAWLHHSADTVGEFGGVYVGLSRLKREVRVVASPITSRIRMHRQPFGNASRATSAVWTGTSPGRCGRSDTSITSRSRPHAVPSIITSPQGHLVTTAEFANSVFGGTPSVDSPDVPR